MEPIRAQYKIIMLGDSGVGKTSVINRLEHGEFVENVSTTIGTFYTEKPVKRPDGSTIVLRIFDTAGQERYRGITRFNYNEAAVALLVFDVTKPESFDQLKGWLSDMKDFAPENVVPFIIGNKTDLFEQQVITIDKAQPLADSVNAKLKFVSAKDGSGMQELLAEIVDSVDPVKDYGAAVGGHGGSAKGGDAPKIEAETKKRSTIKLGWSLRAKIKRKCCS